MNKKIIIVEDVGMSTQILAIAEREGVDVEIISLEQAMERNLPKISLKPEPLPIVIPDGYFKVDQQLPITRAQRRAAERKRKNKKP